MSLSREYFEGEEEVLPQEEQEDATTQKMKELQQEVNMDAKAAEIQEKTEIKPPSETPTQDTDHRSHTRAGEQRTFWVHAWFNPGPEGR
jgi:hypothetical protein